MAPLYVDGESPQLGAVGSMLRLANNDILAVDLLGGRVVRVNPAGELSHFAFIPPSIESAADFSLGYRFRSGWKCHRLGVGTE